MCGEEGAAGITSRALALVWRHWTHYRAGFLPFSGGTQDQPWYLMECLAAAEQGRFRAENERAEELREGREGGPAPKGVQVRRT